MCSAARRAVPPQPTLPRRASASRAPPAVSCATRRSTTPIPLPLPRACVRAPCVRCVHARRGVRSGEARRLCVLRACVPLPIRVRPGAGGANEAQAGTYHYHTTATEIHVRAYIRVSSWVVRLARCTPPRSCSSASHDRADRAATHLDEAGGRRGGAPSLQLQPSYNCYIIR